MKQIVIQVPSEIYEVLEFYNLEKELEKEIKLLLAIELFRKGYLTLEQASKLVNISIADFIEELNKRNIPIWNTQKMN